jgi:hypothetical protein
MSERCCQQPGPPPVCGGRASRNLCGRPIERILWCCAGGYLLVAGILLLVALLRFLRSCIRGRTPRPPGKRTNGSVTGSAPAGIIPEFAFREADPLLYSQFWLQKQGLAVTWQNPDFRLELASAPGVPVEPSTLSPNTKYRVFVRIWNGSVDGPAADVEVHLSYLDFGIG